MSGKSENDTPVEAIAGRRDGGLLLLCDHASHALPAAYGTLGLSREDLETHIAYDIGAAAITRSLAASFEAPALLTRFSRLLIDPNRGAEDPTLVMRLSDGRIIPGNARIESAEIVRRRQHYWLPYRQAIAAEIAAMLNAGPPPAVIGIHTFTPVWKKFARPWQVGILWDGNPRFARPLIAALAADGIVVGDNEPYAGRLPGDTLDAEITPRGLAGLLIEIRQDLVADLQQAHAWAERLGRILRPILDRPEIHEIDTSSRSRIAGISARRA
ncbi:MAG TPA: N-formylglutamate amidohydrolase [Methylovirgula sp.]|nr:N-formylglutamate amidohydrolase [Methylovirgula sp.]